MARMKNKCNGWLSDFRFQFLFFHGPLWSVLLPVCQNGFQSWRQSRSSEADFDRFLCFVLIPVTLKGTLSEKDGRQSYGQFHMFVPEIRVLLFHNI